MSPEELLDEFVKGHPDRRVSRYSVLTFTSIPERRNANSNRVAASIWYKQFRELDLKAAVKI